MSASDNPSAKTRIAYSLSWTNFREWNKYGTQKSATIQLEAGKKYYIEALHKEGGGGDHLSVAWTLPNGTMEAPIAGNRLSPFAASNSDDDDDDDDDDDGDRKASVGKTTTLSAARSAEAIAEEVATTKATEGFTIYPNPVVGATVVNVSVVKAGRASVVVLDVSGRVVRSLFSGMMQADSAQRLSFDAGGLAKGTYFIRFVSADGVATKKVAKTD